MSAAGRSPRWRWALLPAVPLGVLTLLWASTPLGWRTAVRLLPGEERRDLDSLAPAFRACVAELLEHLPDHGFHPVVRGTWRNARRQGLYHRLGGSQRATGSLHQAMGAAGDPAAAAVDIADLWPLIDFDHAAAFYIALRDIAPGHGLVTGGTWARSNPRWAAYDLGWDPGHVQSAGKGRCGP